MSPYDGLVTALEVWDARCQQAPKDQPTRRVPNLHETLECEREFLAVCEAEGLDSYRLRALLTRARFEGLPPHEAVPTAVQRAKGAA